MNKDWLKEGFIDQVKGALNRGSGSGGSGSSGGSSSGGSVDTSAIEAELEKKITAPETTGLIALGDTFEDFTIDASQNIDEWLFSLDYDSNEGLVNVLQVASPNGEYSIIQAGCVEGGIAALMLTLTGTMLYVSTNTPPEMLESIGATRTGWQIDTTAFRDISGSGGNTVGQLIDQGAIQIPFIAIAVAEGQPFMFAGISGEAFLQTKDGEYSWKKVNTLKTELSEKIRVFNWNGGNESIDITREERQELRSRGHVIELKYTVDSVHKIYESCVLRPASIGEETIQYVTYYSGTWTDGKTVIAYLNPLMTIDVTVIESGSGGGSGGNTLLKNGDAAKYVWFDTTKNIDEWLKMQITESTPKVALFGDASTADLFIIDNAYLASSLGMSGYPFGSIGVSIIQISRDGMTPAAFIYVSNDSPSILLPIIGAIKTGWLEKGIMLVNGFSMSVSNLLENDFIYSKTSTNTVSLYSTGTNVTLDFVNEVYDNAENINVKYFNIDMGGTDAIGYTIFYNFESVRYNGQLKHLRYISPNAYNAVIIGEFTSAGTYIIISGQIDSSASYESAEGGSY